MLSRRLIQLTSMRHFSDFFSTGSNSYYIETMYDSWKQDPKSVHISWQAFFTGMQNNLQSPYIPPPGVSTSKLPSQFTSESFSASTKYSQKANVIMQAYQTFGYILADLDPLQLHKSTQSHGINVRIPGIIRLSNYKLQPEDMKRQVDIGSDLIKGFSDVNGPKKGIWQFQELIDACTEVYCGKIGFDFMHIPFRDQRNWMRQRVEKSPQFQNSSTQKKALYQKLTRGHLLEEFFHKKFTTHKRFGMDGLQGVILALDSVINRAVENGVENFVIGMPHRGRLSVMAQILGFHLTDMFSLFFGVGNRFLQEGDVKYHLGQHTEREINGKKIKLTLLANPSHLEAVDPVALGYTRAIQNTGSTPKKSLTILLHGDAALAGQGVVYETLQLEDLYQYSTGGCVHIVMNNNIGFTTTPREARTSLFPTEIAKVIGAPILHVNSECPQEIDFVGKMALDWRTEFSKSVFVDIIGYRRYGHNQLDEPLFTNPLMYQIINKKTPGYHLFAERLTNQGVLNQDDIVDIKKEINNYYEEKFNIAKKKAEIEQSNYTKNFLEWRSSRKLLSDPQNTGMDIDRLREIGLAFNTLPEDIHAHPQIKKIYKQRVSAVQKGTGIDWALGESLAWASLLAQNKSQVRISGQDVQRGTFSQRHSVIHDQQTDLKKYIPLNNIQPGQAKFTTINSNLSEFGVLGFEYGYSMSNPHCLTMWEAQFGDFANGAQVMIDQFITSGEAKWGQQSGLVMLLPHGYDGQGAEHSCARLGRFLQLSSESYDDTLPDKIAQRKQSHYSNFQLVDPTTPANYFHMLRRQVLREFRKPLIVISPKKLLRHKLAVSNLEDFGEGRVVRMYDDWSDIEAPEKIRKVIMCTGQVYYDLFEERKRRGIKDIAITRVEQITPFPYDKVQEIGRKYKNAHFQWVQEEPRNLGAYRFVDDRINLILEELGMDRISIVSRPTSATAATGYLSVHTAELLDILNKAMS